MADQSARLCETVTEAASKGEPLYINGGGSKRQLIGRHCNAAVVEVSEHRGIIDYQPDELMLSARAGTPVVEIQAALADRGQELPFEPAQFGGRATLGGTLASNLSGPARPWFGSIRDAVLGVQLINGNGQLLNFGGKVMKNVAGYDVSRLQAGALGTLGLISQIHLKVLPVPEAQTTLVYELGASEALALMNRRATQPKPLSGACWFDDRLYLRLSGASAAVQQTAGLWGGEQCTVTPWEQLREMTLPFFAGDAPLWRLSLSSTAPIDTRSTQLLDWGGAQRWFRGAAPAEPTVGQGHLSLFAGGNRNNDVRGALDPVQQTLQQRLKKSFDPLGIFNPGRLYSWM